jgi:CRP/FNR family cyclic AMP-dependent transcriptional regulator
MATRSQYLEHLAQVPLFASLSKRELQKLARASDEMSLDKDRVLVEQDTTGHEAFVILEGEAVVKRGGRKVATLGPGDHFGELALLDGGPRTASVIAVTPLQVLVLGQREFAGLLDEVPGLAHKVLANLAAWVRELDAKTYP